MSSIAVGVPSWPRPSTDWDWWALVGVALTLLILRRSVRAPINVPTLAAALVGGVVFAPLVQAIGVVPALAVALLLSTLIALLRRSASSGMWHPPYV
jgi:hypothetical protein